ncbi:FG-GAP repeat domain-containing protein [Streptomyces sp. NPDC050504]|uniref:FG-GAP repeat domain-containing protein n=1 Tax=Streptomyces sp. NPDC050504 TaxID=3365618 RepID=UPI00379C9F7B
MSDSFSSQRPLGERGYRPLRHSVTLTAITMAAVASVLLSSTTASAAVIPDRSEIISKESGVLYGFHNNGTNSNGTVNWGPKTSIGQGWGSVADTAVYFADLNGDGWDDLVSKESGVLYGFTNNSRNANGTINWGPKTSIGQGWGAVSNDAVYFADLNGDNRDDLVSKESGVLYGFTNNGTNSNGTVNWGPKTSIGQGWGAVADDAVSFADLNGDGRDDLVSKESGVLYGFTNNGYNSNGTVNWGSKTSIGQGWGSVADNAVYFADLTLDGRSEIVSKENGALYKFTNNGYNSNGTVNWGAKTQIGQGWGAVSNDAVYFAEIS